MNKQSPQIVLLSVHRLLQHTTRHLNAWGVLAASLFVVAGLLGPDLHALTHARHLHEASAQDCALDPGTVHFERDLSAHHHGDCTLSSRNSAWVSPAEGPEASLDTNAQGTIVAESLLQRAPVERDRVRGPPAAI